MELTEKTYMAFEKQCGRCRHFDWGLFVAGGFCCKAFPDGIPKKIWRAKTDHRKPYPGDNGIMFLAAEDKEYAE